MSNASPDYYREVRIHRVDISSNNEVKINRTLAKEFNGGKTIYRHIFQNILDLPSA